MKRLLAALCVSLLPSLLWDAPAAAQDRRPEPIADRDEQGWMSSLRRLRRPTMERNSARVRRAFRDSVVEPRQWTARVLSDGKEVAMATVVSSYGYLLTKASELQGELECTLYDGRRLPASIVGIDYDSDLALLQVEATGLPAAQWRREPLAVGSWVVTPGEQELPASIGVVSVAPRRVEAMPGVLGIMLRPGEAEGAEVSRVEPGSGADRAGMKVDDLIVAVNGKPVANHDEVIAMIRRHRPGDRIQVELLRDGTPMKLSAMLTDPSQLGRGQVGFQDSLGGPLSVRRAGFPLVLQHDTILRPEDCGGPLVDLDGQVVGINIARAGRVASYALPAHVVLDLLSDLLPGDPAAGAAHTVARPVSSE